MLNPRGVGRGAKRNTYVLKPWVRRAKCSPRVLLCDPIATVLTPPTTLHSLPAGLTPGCLIPSRTSRPGTMILFKYHVDYTSPLLPAHHEMSLESEPLLNLLTTAPKHSVLVCYSTPCFPLQVNSVIHSAYSPS